MELSDLRILLQSGLVIPAYPLALSQNGKWSERHQKALTRYYYDSGSGGLAVGVHSTQFAIRDPQHGLFQPVLELASKEIDSWSVRTPRAFVKIAGICGNTDQAANEARIAVDLGYHAGLLSMTALNECDEEEVLTHCKEISTIIPIVGFYLQPSVGGRVYSYEFWRKFVEIENLIAIKIAPFNRYQTLDVVRAVIEADREDVALYTGNDDHIIGDLITPFTMNVNGQPKSRFIAGGLLGQWGVWTKRAVELLEDIKKARYSTQVEILWLTLNAELTDANAAIFDAANSFKGCIPGILEILRRQGLIESNRCLDPDEVLSPGQSEELDRVIASYPHLVDDVFVNALRDVWLSD